MAKKTDIKTLEQAEELSEFELAQIEGGSKVLSTRKEAKEESAKKHLTPNREEGNKKQIASSELEGTEVIKKL